MAESENSSDNKPNVHIKIGGSVGPASAIGADNTVTAQNVAGRNVTIGSSSIENATREDFLILIQELQAQVEQLQNQFDPDDATDVQDALEKVAEMSVREKPPGNRMRQQIENVCDIIKDAAAAGAAVAPLLPIAQQAWEMVRHLFGA